MLVFLGRPLSSLYSLNVSRDMHCLRSMSLLVACECGFGRINMIFDPRSITLNLL